MSFLPHIEAIISKSSRMLGFIKRISRDFHDPYTHKTLYTSLVRPNLEHSASVWSPHQSVHSAQLERVQHNFICYAVRRLPWRVWSLPAYDARCLLIGLEEICRQCSLCEGHSGWQGRLFGPCSHATI
jgi:hypothetical protein